MLKKTMKYTDYNGNERTEDFYFNLTKAEAMEMELETIGGLTNVINRVIAAQDVPELVRIFKGLITRSYGVKSLDGKRFEKSEELLNAFTQTEAYSDLFMELATSADAATAFINGVAPTIEKDTQPAPAVTETPANVTQIPVQHN